MSTPNKKVIYAKVPVGLPVAGQDLVLHEQKLEVLCELCTVLNDNSPGCTAGLTFQLTSCGERQPKAIDKASRRVEVFFPDRP